MTDQAPSLFLDAMQLKGMRILGNRYLPRVEAMEVGIETAFLLASTPHPQSMEELKELTPDVELRFSGMHILETNPDVYLQLSAASGKIVTHAVAGAGVFILGPKVFGLKHFAGQTWTVTRDDLQILGTVLEELGRVYWKLNGVMTVHFGDLSVGVQMHPEAVHVCFSLALPCSEEVYTQRLQFQEETLQQANSHVVMLAIDAGKGTRH